MKHTIQTAKSTQLNQQAKYICNIKITNIILIKEESPSVADVKVGDMPQ